MLFGGVEGSTHHTAAEGAFDFRHQEFATGGTKFPTRAELSAHHPETGEEMGRARYFPPKRRNAPLHIDEVNGHVPGAASALLNEIEARHPGSPTKFLHEVRRNNNDPSKTGHELENAGKPTDWDTHHPQLADTIHRGITLRLPQSSARVVNAADATKEDHLAHLHDALPSGHSLGMHWTENEHSAQLFAHNAVSDYRTDIPVVLHARTPAAKDLETRRDHLYRGGVFPYGDPHSPENEVPVRKGRPIHVTGISWRPDAAHPDADEEGWVHHTYDEPMQHKATVDVPFSVWHVATQEPDQLTDEPEADVSDLPHTCSYCGSQEFETPEDTGRGLRAVCTACGGAMLRTDTGVWTPAGLGSTHNHPRPEGDPASGGVGGAANVGVDPDRMNDASARHGTLQAFSVWEFTAEQLGLFPEPEHSLSWEDIGARHPHIYGNNEDTGSEQYADAASMLAHDRPGHGEDEGSNWHIDEMRFHPEHVPVHKIDYVDHGGASDSRVRHAAEGYRQNPDKVPPLILVHRHGVYQVADGHHRAEGARLAGQKTVPAYVAHSPYPDEPFADGLKAPFNRDIEPEQAEHVAALQVLAIDAHDLTSGARGLADAFRGGHTVLENMHAGAASRSLQRVALSDGRHGVLKTHDEPEEARHAYLAGLLGNAVGVHDVHTALVAPRQTLTTLIPGRNGAELQEEAGDTEWGMHPKRDELQRHTQLEGGREIGAQDFLSAHVDRMGNYHVHENQVRAVDNDYANFEPLSARAGYEEVHSPFTQTHFTKNGSVYGNIDVHPHDLRSPYTPEEMEHIHRNVAALRPEFERVDARPEHDYALRQLDKLRGVPRRTAMVHSSADEEWRLQHKAPTGEVGEDGSTDGSPMHDVSQGGHGVFPEDVYTHPRYYDSGHQDYYRAWSTMKGARNNPEKKIRVYRSLPAEHAHTGFNHGDWVSTSKEYARDHGKQNDDPKHDWPVISTTVPAKHLHNEGDLMEWGYSDPHQESTVAFRGGHHQEVRQRADGTIGRVQRKAKSPERQRADTLKDAGYTFRHYTPNQHGEGDHTVVAYGPDDNWAGIVKSHPDGTVHHVDIDPEHQHMPLEEHMRSFLPKLHHEGALYMEAAWRDVQTKAKRIRKAGGVNITVASTDGVAGEVRGDTHVYEVGITWVPGTTKTAAWTCGCKWGAYAWGPTWDGRPCSHVLAMRFEAQSRSMHGRQIEVDQKHPDWLKPQTSVVVQYERPSESHPKGRDMARRAVPPGNMRSVWDSKSRTRHSSLAKELLDSDLDPAEVIERLATQGLSRLDAREAVLAARGRLFQKTAKECPECSADLDATATRCDDCGAVLPQHSVTHSASWSDDEQRCPHCGGYLGPEAFKAGRCPHCGHALAHKTAAVDYGVWYHGASPERAEKVRREGLPKSYGGEYDLRLTNSPQQARIYGDMPGRGRNATVFEFHIPHDHPALHPVYEHNLFNEHAHGVALRESLGPEYIAAEHRGADDINGSSRIAAVIPPGWEGAQGPFESQYTEPHVYARDIHSGAGNCVCGGGLGDPLHLQAAPGVDVPEHQRYAYIDQKHRPHRTEDARKNAPKFGEDVPDWGLTLVDCPQCGGRSGCGHCGGTGQVISLDGTTGNPTPDQNPAAGKNLREDGLSDTSALHPQFAAKSNAPTVAGVALVAGDTGRVLMIQRSNKDPKDPARGRWEVPGGHLEEGDQTSLHGAIREFEEEVGQKFPTSGTVTHSWRSGPYQGHVVTVPNESSIDFSDGRSTVNPDDPDGDDHEQSAWWEVEHARKNPALRDEAKTMPWSKIKSSPADAGLKVKALMARSGPTMEGASIMAPGREQSNTHEAAAWDSLYSLEEAQPVTPPPHSQSENPASSGFLTTQDPQSWSEVTKRPHHLMPADSLDSPVATLHDVPQGALPFTDGTDLEDSTSGTADPYHGQTDTESLDGDTDGIPDTEQEGSPMEPLGGMASKRSVQDIVEAFQRTAGARALQGAGEEGGDKMGFSNSEIAAAARERLGGLSKTALANFSFAEQQELIQEGKGARARNFGDLSIEGTHYHALQSAIDAAGVADDDILIL